MQLNERLLSAVVHHSENAVVITTNDIENPEIVYINPAFTRMTGYAAAEVMGKTPYILQGPRTDIEVLVKMKKDLQAGRFSRGCTIMYRKDGTEFVSEWHIEPVRDDEKHIIHFVGFHHDVTEKHVMQDRLRQLMRLEAMGLMAGGITHDFKNILCIINGYSELGMMRQAQNPEALKMFSAVHDAAHRGLALTRRLLTITSDKQLAFDAVQINDVCQSFRDMINNIFPKNIAFKLELKDGLLPVFADAGQIEQILLNASLNSRDAMPDGGVITLSTFDELVEQNRPAVGGNLKPGRYVGLKISDSGSGMPESTLKNIFNDFFTTKEPGKGTGLGLTVMRTIVAEHHGGVDVVSTLGRGTEFTFYFPAFRRGTEIIPKVNCAIAS